MTILVIIAVSAWIFILFVLYRKFKRDITFSGYIDDTFIKKGRRIKITGFFDGKIIDVETGFEYEPKIRGNEK